MDFLSLYFYLMFLGIDLILLKFPRDFLFRLIWDVLLIFLVYNMKQYEYIFLFFLGIKSETKSVRVYHYHEADRTKISTFVPC